MALAKRQHCYTSLSKHHVELTHQIILVRHVNLLFPLKKVGGIDYEVQTIKPSKKHLYTFSLSSLCFSLILSLSNDSLGVCEDELEP